MHHHSIVGLLDKTPKLPNETYVYMLLFEKLRDPVTFSTYEIAGSRNLVVQISQKGMQEYDIWGDGQSRCFADNEGSSERMAICPQSNSARLRVDLSFIRGQRCRGGV